MAPKALRWGKLHNEALKRLFATKSADPERQESDCTDGIWNNEPEGSVLRARLETGDSDTTTATNRQCG